MTAAIPTPSARPMTAKWRSSRPARDAGLDLDPAGAEPAGPDQVDERPRAHARGAEGARLRGPLARAALEPVVLERPHAADHREQEGRRPAEQQQAIGAFDRAHQPPFLGQYDVAIADRREA